MTKDELSNLRNLKREILDLERRKRDCEAAAMSITSVLDGMPHQHGIDKVALFGGDAAWYSIQLDNAMARYREEFRRLWMYIENIKDARTRQIFRHKYIDGMTWQAVAFAVGENDRTYVWRIAEAYLKDY